MSCSASCTIPWRAWRSAAQVQALAERRFDGMHLPVLMIDGVEYAGETMIVAVGITADGAKRVLGLRQGATENATVCVAPRRNHFPS
jgi:putative transposase